MRTVPTEVVSRVAPPRACSDRELLTRFLATREEAAFSEIVSRHGGLVMAVAWRWLRDRHAAEDVFQATFLVLAQQARPIRKVESLAAWLHGTAMRVARKSLARRHRRRECVMPLDELDRKAAEDIIRWEEQAAIDEAIARLPESLRGPLVLHYLQDKPAPQIAAELGLSLSAVEGRLRRGRRELKSRLVRRGIGLGVVFATVHPIAAPAEAAIGEAMVAATTKVCAAAVRGTAIPTLVTSEATHLAAKELVAMSKLGLMKTGLTWGVAALGLGVVGALSTTGSLLNGANAGGQGAAVAQEEGTGGASATPETGIAEASPAAAAAADGIGAQGSGGIAPASFSLPAAEGNADASAVAAPGGQTIVNDIDPAAGDMMSSMMGMAAAGAPQSPPGPTVFDYQKLGPNEERIHEALEQQVNFQFNGQTLDQVLRFLEDDYKITIRLDEAELAEVGTGADSEINLVIAGVTLQSALKLMLDDVNGTELEYIIQDEVMTITTAAKAETMLATRVYDVRGLKPMTSDDLARVIAHSVRPETWRKSIAEVQKAQRASAMGGMGGMAMPAGMPGMSYSGMAGDDAQTPSNLGGGEGWIESLEGALVITQSQPVHREIIALLEQLSRYAQVESSNASLAPGMMAPGMPAMGGMPGRMGAMSSMGGMGMGGMGMADTTPPMGSHTGRRPGGAMGGMSGMGLGAGMMMGGMRAMSPMGSRSARGPGMGMEEMAASGQADGDVVLIRSPTLSVTLGISTWSMAPIFLVNAADEEIVPKMIEEHDEEIGNLLSEIITKDRPKAVGNNLEKPIRKDFLQAVNGLLFPDEPGRIRAVMIGDVKQKTDAEQPK